MVFEEMYYRRKIFTVMDRTWNFIWMLTWPICLVFIFRHIGIASQNADKLETKFGNIIFIPPQPIFNHEVTVTLNYTIKSGHSMKKILLHQLVGKIKLYVVDEYLNKTCNSSNGVYLDCNRSKIDNSSITLVFSNIVTNINYSFTLELYSVLLDPNAAGQGKEFKNFNISAESRFTGPSSTFTTYSPALIEELTEVEVNMTDDPNKGRRVVTDILSIIVTSFSFCLL